MQELNDKIRLVSDKTHQVLELYEALKNRFVQMTKERNLLQEKLMEQNKKIELLNDQLRFMRKTEENPGNDRKLEVLESRIDNYVVEIEACLELLKQY